MNQADRPPKVFYEIFVRSFCDSNQDGLGDLNGITSKLDYLQYLGVEGIWLTPFFKSDTYHKYDVIDYYQVDPQCGTLADFERLIHEAHERGIKVLIDFVINHTSKKNPWFLEAKKGKGNTYRDYYVWMTPAQIKQRGIEIREKTADSGETNPWHWAQKGDSEKYYGMFWNEMPDLNMDNPKVREEIYAIGKFWLEKGVDGFRMDAAKHIYPEWEAEKCHDFWFEFRQRMEAVKPDIYVVGEVWTKAAKVAPFFKGLKANFNFDLSDALQNIVKTGKDKLKIVEMLIANYKMFEQIVPDFVDATMLTNHDQNRIGSIADGHQDKLKMAATLLLTLPGNPFIYYGEELGMKGVKPDENLREAFLWNTRNQDRDRSNWRKPKYNTDSKVKPLRLQTEDSDSLFWHYKNLISLRKSTAALAQIYQPNLSVSSVKSTGLLSFIRPHQEGSVLVIQNITDSSQRFYIKESIESQLFSYKVQSLDGNDVVLNAYGCLVLMLRK
ncbi:alpha-amylase family glycosyl hydrolase [Lacihabitans lacunae]|uniref:Alpha-amylase n=1 Tax=Lacihabitans lacunae TaxID=1028214 RepID=A0ABV7YYW8_9BACT